MFEDCAFKDRPTRQLYDFYAEMGFTRLRDSAARELGVTRQAMNKYVQGTSAPRIPVLLRAEAAWQIKFKFRGITLFGERARPQPEARSLTGEQMPLFDQPQVLENQAIRISATKSRRTLDVHLRLKLTG